MRPIDADSVLKRIKNAIAFYSHPTQGDFDTGRKIGLISAEEIVAEEPILDYAPVKHGHWEKEEDFIGKKYRCTMCKKVIRYDRAYVCQGELIFDFCPFCGADMRGEENDES